jgi:hypothetical protein
LEFAAFKREKMLLHIFRAENGAKSSSAVDKGLRKAQEPRVQQDGSGIIADAAKKIGRPRADFEVQEISRGKFVKSQRFVD